MTFRSILFADPDAEARAVEPEGATLFTDLNLDQVIESITTGHAEYDLKPLFRTRLRGVDAIHYRHEVLRDLENSSLFDAVRGFATGMRAMREQLALAGKLHYRRQKQSYFVAAVAGYCDAVSSLVGELAQAHPRSRGFVGLRAYVTEYARSAGFTSLLDETRKLEEDLGDIRYCVHIKGSRVSVAKYDEEADYSAEVEATFDKFKQGAVKDCRVEFSTELHMNHVEARVLDLVTRLYPDVFSALDGYCDRHREYVDEIICRFDREVQFYVAILEHVRTLESAGLAFCYPSLSEKSKEVSACTTFDLALAGKLVSENAPVVCNDFHLDGGERVFVVSGPNQGGKTTFARTFGQLHYLATIGCPVPGTRARLFVFDQLFTHFEKEEDLKTLRGKLQDDLVRTRDILTRATGDSIVIMNEIFTSTTLRDALFLGRKVMEQLTALNLLCVYVTFIDELASMNEATVSMVGTVEPDNPAARTYKVVRRPADGRSYAAAIAEKYGLSYERLRGRVAS